MSVCGFEKLRLIYIYAIVLRRHNDDDVQQEKREKRQRFQQRFDIVSISLALRCISGFLASYVDGGHDDQFIMLSSHFSCNSSVCSHLLLSLSFPFSLFCIFLNFAIS